MHDYRLDKRIEHIENLCYSLDASLKKAEEELRILKQRMKEAEQRICGDDGK
ncbi:hypothetical protein D3C87_1617840 [compost metagenome]